MAKPRSPHPGMALPLMEPDPIAPTRLRELREMALDRARGREYAAELSDDPDQANIEAEEYLADQPTPLLPPKVRGQDRIIREESWDEAEGRAMREGRDPYRENRRPRLSSGDMEVAQAASEEGGQTVEEAREGHESGTEGMPEDYYDPHRVPGFTEAFEDIMSSLSPEDQDLLTGGGDLKERSIRWLDIGGRAQYPLYRPEIRRALEQIDQLRAETREEGKAGEGRWERRREFEREFPEEGE